MATKKGAPVSNELTELFSLLAQCERALKGTPSPRLSKRTPVRKKASSSKKRSSKRVAKKHVPKKAAQGTHVVYPNISRLDYPKIHGYGVRFQRKSETGEGRRVVAKRFSDLQYGGAPAAFAAAIVWRNQTAKKIPPSQRRPSMGYPNPPGYSYIKVMPQVSNSRGVQHEYLACVVFLRIENMKHLTTRWSIDKWGKAVARRRCEEWLAKKKHELELRLAKRSSRTARQPATTLL